ncbi:hypothetical protein K458DRAFT_58350 [Lentithecium fluviatile CBS 122367]|uniref:Uncharacterized protein n=1 Tax=Lentithecium fluviatile CBS 122367 TaxID=1168545 RepID=A0A6G1IVY5_9PLEO|nr:hypothetical protein K458DRAFT_58350 [Lentithecium fluviatile CBS 122367]
MTSPIDDQWDIINPPTLAPTTMATNEQPAPAASPKFEVTINTKPADNSKPEPLKPARQTTNDSDLSNSDVDVEEVIRPRPARRNRRNTSYSPVRIYNRYPPLPVTPMLNSSTQLLENVGYDGIADMPYPGRANIYLTTFPFTDRDVKKWSWLFAHGVEDMWLTAGEKSARDDDDEDSMDECFDDGRGRYPRPARNHRRNFNAVGTVDVSSVYLSRALDTAVIPEDTPEKVKYLIVVQNRSKPSGGAKLLTAESRKAAGIALYYEALTGNSIVFVGAVVGNVGKKAKKFRKVEGVDEAKNVSEAGAVGVIC